MKSSYFKTSIIPRAELPLSQKERGPWGEVIFALLFIFLINSFSVSAQNKRLSISTFNDNWGGGFTEIKDDYRSFGFSISDEFLLFKKDAKVQLVYSGFTNKFAPDSTRLDELMFKAEIPLFTVKEFLTFQAIAGFYATGNLGGENIQNKIHGGVGVENTTLNYPDSNHFYGLFGGRLQSAFPLAEKQDATPVFLLEGEYFLAPNYLQSVNGSIGFGLQNEYLDAIKLTVGLNHQKVFTEPTRTMAAEVERGVFISYKAHLGLATFEIIAFPNNQFSMGMLGINLLNGRKRKALKTIDVMAEYGAFTQEQGLYQRYLWNKITRHQNHFQFDLHHQFWRINGSSNPNFPNQYGHFRQISFGGNYHPIAPSQKFQVLPFISVRVGHKTEKLYSGETPQSNQMVWSLNAIGEAGLRVKLPANFIHKNCYYGGTASYSYAAPFYRNSDVVQTNGYAFAQPIGAFSFGAFVMIDL